MVSELKTLETIIESESDKLKEYELDEDGYCPDCQEEK